MNTTRFFRRTSIDELRLHTLEQTERELHDAQLQLEYYQAIVPLLQARRTRLRAALDNKEPRP